MELVQARILTDDVVAAAAAFYAALLKVPVAVNDYYVEVPAGSAGIGLSRQRFTEALPTQGTCHGPTIITCDLGTIPAGQIATILVKAKLDPAMPAGTNLRNSAQGSSSTFDPDLSNNSATATNPIVS